MPEEQQEPSFKTLKELGGTSARMPNRAQRRKQAKKHGLFKKQNKGQWKWLTKGTEQK
jgi:hypothetical protein